MASETRRSEILQRLPVPYATALRLRDAGGTADEIIAERVGIELDALPTFMKVAEAKLAAASPDDVTSSGRRRMRERTGQHGPGMNRYQH